MLTATEARKAIVHGTFRKPSTKRSDVVKPTSNKPPTISQSQGMNILSLDESCAFVTLPTHGEVIEPRQQDRASALSGVPCLPGCRLLGGARSAEPLGTGSDGLVRRRRSPVPNLLPVAARYQGSAGNSRARKSERRQPHFAAGHHRNRDG